jgi:hypothetical protein
VLTALGKLIAAILEASFNALRYLIERPKLGAVVVALTFLILLAKHVHYWWLLPTGVGLLLWGLDLRRAGH